MAIDMEKLKELLKGKVIVYVVGGLLVLLLSASSLKNGNSSLLTKKEASPTNKYAIMQTYDKDIPTEIEGNMDLDKTKLYEKLTPRKSYNKVNGKSVTHLSSDRGAYPSVTAVRVHVAQVLDTLGIPKAQVYVSTSETVRGNQVHYVVDSISIFTNSDEIRNEKSTLIEEVLKTTISGTFKVKVYGTLNTNVKI